MSDGFDFILIDKDAKTELGRLLDNSTYSPINTDFGSFDRIDDFIKYINYNSCTGIDFYTELRKALDIKINTDKQIRNLLYESILPIVAKDDWLAEQYEDIRNIEKNRGFSVIIAGSRSIENYTRVVDTFILSGLKPTEIVSGGARGVDRLGERLAKQYNLPVVHFIPDWEKYGKKAGILRNIEMAKYAHALIAIMDIETPGTKHMINTAIRYGLLVVLG